MPWHRPRGSGGRPRNVASTKCYQGVNVLTLWLAAEANGFAANVWGTYRQWQAAGAQVRKGERSSLVVFYKTIESRSDNDVDDGEDRRRVALARANRVFNAEQVEGFATVPAVSLPQLATIEPVTAAEALLSRTGADLREGGHRAYYSVSGDYIALPGRQFFTGSPTMTPTEAWYATALHELTHWTGAPHRLDRNLSARFGQNAYAMEELIAELGSSYLCADLGVTTSLRPDHAAYIQTWLAVLRSDKRAVFTAAARAQAAAGYLSAFLPTSISLALVDTIPQP